MVLAVCLFSRALAGDPVGEWATQGYLARVRITPCASADGALCGTITWLWEPLDKNGAKVRDANNPVPALRTRALIGLDMLEGLRPASADLWANGKIYNPENGKTYSASMTLRSHDILEVQGCVLFVCSKQIWRRAESVCTDAPIAPSS